MTRNIFFRLFVIVLLMLTLMLVSTGIFCIWKQSQKEIVIEYVIPDGFRGLIFLEDSPSGVEPIVKRSGNEIIYTYSVPDDGRLFVRSDSPTYSWHRTRSHYRSGEKLPARGFDVVTENGVSLIEISGNAILVGTAQDEKVYWRRQGMGPPIVSPGPLSQVGK